MLSCYPTMTAHTAETIKGTELCGAAVSSYSPDLAASDCHLFDPLKGALRGSRFTPDQQMHATVHACLDSQPKTMYSEGIMIVCRRIRCIEKQGDYAEN